MAFSLQMKEWRNAISVAFSFVWSLSLQKAHDHNLHLYKDVRVGPG